MCERDSLYGVSIDHASMFHMQNISNGHNFELSWVSCVVGTIILMYNNMRKITNQNIVIQSRKHQPLDLTWSYWELKITKLCPILLYLFMVVLIFSLSVPHHQLAQTRMNEIRPLYLQIFLNLLIYVKNIVIIYKLWKIKYISKFCWFTRGLHLATL